MNFTSNPLFSHDYSNPYGRGNGAQSSADRSSIVVTTRRSHDERGLSYLASVFARHPTIYRSASAPGDRREVAFDAGTTSRTSECPDRYRRSPIRVPVDPSRAS